MSKHSTETRDQKGAVWPHKPNHGEMKVTTEMGIRVQAERGRIVKKGWDGVRTVRIAECVYVGGAKRQKKAGVFQRHLQLFLSSCDWAYKKPIWSGIVNIVRGVRKEVGQRNHTESADSDRSHTHHLDSVKTTGSLYSFLEAELLTCCYACLHHACLQHLSHAEAGLTLFEEFIVNKTQCFSLTRLSLDQDEHREVSGYHISAGVDCLV